MLKFLLSRIPHDVAKSSLLLIDDDRDIRTVTSLVLMTRGGIGTVHEAATGREGLRMARHHRPSVILLDVGLPDMKGETVLQLLKADPWTSHIPVVFFTARAREHQRLCALQAADTVLKPFDPEQLCATVTRALHAAQANHIYATGALRKPPHGDYLPPVVLQAVQA